MKMSQQQAQEIIETMAFQHAAENAETAAGHSSRILRVEKGGWHGQVIAANPAIPHTLTAEAFKKAFDDIDMPVIFIPAAALITHEIVMRICRESGLDKIVIWEEN